MDPLSFTTVLDMAAKFGIPGMILFMWWYDNKQVHEILRMYRKDMDEQRQMYLNNVELVKQYMRLSGDLTEIIQLNTQVQTQLVESIRSNMYCPFVREKWMK